MQVEGRCHCGAVHYRAEVDPEKVVICHCTDCQTLSGSAFRTVAPTLAGSFELLTGELKVYVKTGDSGNRREQSFCPECGTPIYSAPVAPEPRIVGLRVGALLQRDQLVPAVQLWTRSAQSWVDRIAAIPALSRQPEFGSRGEIDGATE